MTMNSCLAEFFLGMGILALVVVAVLMAAAPEGPEYLADTPKIQVGNVYARTTGEAVGYDCLWPIPWICCVVCGSDGIQEC